VVGEQALAELRHLRRAAAPLRHLAKLDRGRAALRRRVDELVVAVDDGMV
jgi:hypothetical protein